MKTIKDCLESCPEQDYGTCDDCPYDRCGFREITHPPSDHVLDPYTVQACIDALPKEAPNFSDISLTSAYRSGVNRCRRELSFLLRDPRRKAMEEAMREGLGDWYDQISPQRFRDIIDAAMAVKP